MRLFLAIDPPETAVEEVRHATAPLRGRFPDLRWSAADAQHLTLVFLGEVPEDQVDSLQETVAHALRTATAMRLGLAGVGTFPRDRAQARVLWLGLRGDLHALHRHQGALTKALTRAGFALQARKYVPHLTLARCRVPTDLADQLGELERFTGHMWAASQVVLYHSTPGGTPRYRTVATWDLPSN